MNGMNSHTAAVRKHINDLHAKDYSSISELESPNFVIMFMPVEPAFIEALKHDKELFNYGVQKNVILVSHTTLNPILRTIQNLWILEQQNREAKELGNAALEIWNSVCEVTKQVQDLGKSLGTCGNKYNSLVTKLVGNQGLSRKIEKFDTMSTNAKKEMVTDHDPIHIGGDDQRLNLQEKDCDSSVLADPKKNLENSVRRE